MVGLPSLLVESEALLTGVQVGHCQQLGGGGYGPDGGPQQVQPRLADPAPVEQPGVKQTGPRLPCRVGGFTALSKLI